MRNDQQIAAVALCVDTSMMELLVTLVLMLVAGLAIGYRYHVRSLALNVIKRLQIFFPPPTRPITETQVETAPHITVEENIPNHAPYYPPIVQVSPSNALQKRSLSNLRPMSPRHSESPGAPLISLPPVPLFNSPSHTLSLGQALGLTPSPYSKLPTTNSTLIRNPRSKRAFDGDNEDVHPSPIRQRLTRSSNQGKREKRRAHNDADSVSSPKSTKGRFRSEGRLVFQHPAKNLSFL